MLPMWCVCDAGSGWRLDGASTPWSIVLLLLSIVLLLLSIVLLLLSIVLLLLSIVLLPRFGRSNNRLSQSDNRFCRRSRPIPGSVTQEPGQNAWIFAAWVRAGGGGPNSRCR